MAITCPRCGREYDVTLFQFGRTIHCTCGARVGLEKRLGPPLSRTEPRFIADAMLGGLARWLRILGFDVAYDAAIADEALIRRSLEEERHILTRDRGILEEWRVSGCTLLASDEVEAQLQEVVQEFDLRPKIRLFTRCTLCNVLLVPIPKEAVRERVPSRVYELNDDFSRCPRCERFYWEGTHTERMRARVRELVGG